MKMNKKNKNWGRKIFLILIIVAFALVIMKFSDLQNLYDNIKTGNGYYILAAFIFQLIYFYFFALAYATSFHTVGINTSTRRLFPLIFAYIFVNVVAPTGGVSGPALFATEAAKRKESSVKTLAAVLIANIAQFVTFFIILSFGFIYLFVNQELRLYQIIGALLLFALTGFLVMILVLGIFNKGALLAGLKWCYKRFNRISRLFKSEDKFLEEHAAKDVNEFSSSVIRVLDHPQLFTKTFVFSIVAHIINLISLGLIFAAFQQNFTLGILASGYVMAVLFQIIGITPYGVGLSEGAMTLVLASLGVPTEKAFLITIVFRGMSFWIPFLIGFVLLRKIHIFGLNELSIRQLLIENRFISNIKNAIRDFLEK
jgi:uncharacterized protein (TIRG00374 family)